MNIKLILSASLLSLAGVASAQTAMQITDPSKIAEIERHAEMLRSQPMPQASDMSAMPAKHKAMRHHKKMAAKKAEMKPAPDATTSSTTSTTSTATPPAQK